MMVAYGRVGLQELKFAADCLRADAKNYHAWGHRHALLHAFQLWETELELTSLLLQDDPYNNSAWSQRHAAFSMALARYGLHFNCFSLLVFIPAPPPLSA